MSAMQFSTTSGLHDAAALSLDELLRIVQEGSDAKITLAKLREAFFDNISNSVVLLKKTVTINAGAVYVYLNGAIRLMTGTTAIDLYPGEMNFVDEVTSQRWTMNSNGVFAKTN